MIRYQHTQEWHLVVSPGEGETWPRVFTTAGVEFQPRSIQLYARSGSPPNIAISGYRIRQDGSVGKIRGATRTLPSWAAEKMDAARAELGLTDDYFVSNGAVWPKITPAERS